MSVSSLFSRCLLSVSLVASTVSLAACAHTSDVVDAHAEGKGVARDYPATEDQAWKAALGVMHWAGADSVEEHRAEHYMIASVGANAVSYGTILGAWITPAVDGQMSVSVVSKRKVQTEAVTAMGEDAFQQDFAKALVLVKTGQPLPDKEP